MKLSKLQFDVLVHLMDSSVETLPDTLGICAEEVAKLTDAMIKEGLLDQNLQVTETGIESLAPYRTRRVIFLAAGLGSRLRPATINVPKPMVRVHGKPIICSAIDAALAAGIEEIYIVRGYLGECFDQLLRKYPQIHLVENPDYQSSNNISSAMQVRHLMQNAYVMEADLLINNPAIFRKYHYTSNCLGVPVEKTDDWCILSSNGIAKQLVQGGVNCHHLFSIYYWTAEDGAKLSRHIEEVYHSPGGKERFWDLTPLLYFRKEYHVEIIECKMEDINEIDTLRDLRSVDKMYTML